MEAGHPTTPIQHNVGQWLEENKHFFPPPVCNKMMHQDGQMKLFLVGGPNQRKDFHVECGEELFYQIKGQMCLKVIEQGKHRDVIIKEGQMFLLPAGIHHSPNRYENTVGMVIERFRHESEKDGLRQEIRDGSFTLDPLYEAFFYCSDLGTELAPIIKGFFASEQYITGKPIPGKNLCDEIPLHIDNKTKLQDPIDFKEWIKEHRDELKTKGRIAVYDTERFQFQEGGSQVKIEGKDFTLKIDDSVLVPVDQRYTVTQGENSVCLVTWQDPRKARSWPKAS
ncbi:hypothetical protein CAPTEDRAFT_205859 [Capitella teleta]|uniref:3-hydroxyanthranilate 3,4-dioxygenase n=1 Tax=Capitella teleta TaxID=283909 RepID=R7TY09_CAPTE|nr:hypothetical protein CAPTEDRAFT_205859 [Capitella teleta]|eukprot:ELT95835.1 hypothetical protein CAPTEDRAFT_205859 [Capitella teleta]